MSVSSEFQGSYDDMPDWAKPGPDEPAQPEPTVPPQPFLDPERGRVIASLPAEPEKKPESIDELRAAMQQIIEAPTAPRPTKKERKEARAAARAAQDSGDPEALSDDQWREKARGILLRQLTASDKTAKQLKDKLLDKDCPEHIADEVIDRYAEINLIDDERFAKSWVAARARSRGLARGAIKRELRTKGVDDDTAAEALEQIDDEAEEQRARELARTKLRPESMGADRDKALRRLVGMLGRKGYNGGLAYKIAREEWDERFGPKY
ncbi:regulatory protein RecX [Glutamicibacter sp.]|uniref:regulatory protein RecX n=1 Tax=Glutamicibacter sp. TaxID=1931995 RepID=UPI0028BDD187|nr:regulatory protein RecX [Glutamicibacter sp.]